MPFLGFGKKNIPPMQPVDNRGDFVSVLPMQQQNIKKRAVIGEEQVQKFQTVFQQYQSDKSNLTQRLIDNEKWYRQRHWEVMKREEKDQTKDKIEPKSGYLFNGIVNKHAEMMDNFPSPNILPREKSDIEEAKLLTSIIPVILEQNNFKRSYSNGCEEKCKQGTGCYGVFWDSTKHNGIGDVSVTDVDIMNLFWESGIKDIQKSPYLFYVRLENNDVLKQMCPALKDRLNSSAEYKVDYEFDDNVDTTNKSLVFDCYYKKVINNRVVVHLCTYCNGVVIYASENDERTAQRGIYDHGLYPFVMDKLYSVKGSPAGFGFIDVGKDTQSYIDRTDQSIIKNLLANSKPRYLVSKSAKVNAEEFADLDRDIVYCEGLINENSIAPIQAKSLPGVYVSVRNNKIDELKETIGNRDISTGGTSSGVTAASAIAAMQEAGSKLSRNAISSTYECFKDIVLMMIELIRQYYTLPRSFRVKNENGTYDYLQYSNEKLKVQTVGSMFGGKSTLRNPLFDIEVTVQKQSPYSKLSQNELALQFYGAGFFNPQMTDQALACLDMMDFDRKSFVTEKIQANGTMHQKLLQTQQMLLQLAQMYDATTGRTQFAQQVAAMVTGNAVQPMVGAPPPNADKEQMLGGSNDMGESKVTENARKRVAEMTSPT